MMAGASYMAIRMVGEDLERGKNSSWTDFFRDPSQWWDIRSTKRSPSQPDFTHKITKEPLWLNSRHNPPWVTEELGRRGFIAQHTDALPSSLIWACCKTKDLSRGTRLHDELQKRGLSEKSYADALVTMYAKCGDLEKAEALLDKYNSSSIIPWTALIGSYARQEKGQNALDCYERMQRQGIPPNAVTFVSLVKACAVLGAVDKGKQIHEEISKRGFLEDHMVLGNALVDMYAKCGALPQAHSVLEKLPSRDVVSWTALISGYAQKGQGQQALECFDLMQHEGILPNAVTYASILKACGGIGAIEKGKQIHEEISKQGLLEHEIVMSNALVDMYVKCGALPQAQSVLEELPSPDVVTWNTMITGYVQKGQGQQALECFERMQHEGIRPSVVTYLCTLKACAVVGAIDKGKEIHDEISKQGLLENNVVLSTALLDMYAKCGALPQAQSVLEKLASRSVISWNALITGYAQKGQGQQALECFERMQREGILPDEVTFLCVLNLCNHLGLVEKGQELFDSMEATYGLKPDVECFTCIIDLLGRAGHLVKAVEVIQGMPFSANSAIWRCLLGACRKWVDVNVGSWVFEQATELDKCDASAYVLMVGIYTAAGMQQKAIDIEAMRIKNKAWKLPRCSSWTNPG
ncbi:hypothetical protein GOP47_0027975 [Adiantum capillus-veneris]|nr:hypothetical protein GOP47_0027975 [Adiantum capillus-veneris]